MVVALRAARGERVAEPEAVLERDRVGGVRERRRALVGGDDEVRVVLVEGRARPAGCTTSPPTMLSVTSSMPRISVEYAQLHLVAQRVALARRRAQDEAALGADGHDHGVLDHLRLHQAEHLGAVVLAPVRPADAAARDVAAAQVDALDLRVVDEDLEERRRRGHRGHVGRAQLEAQSASRPSGRRSCAPSRRSARASCAGCGRRRGSATASSVVEDLVAQRVLARLVGLGLGRSARGTARRAARAVVGVGASARRSGSVSVKRGATMLAVAAVGAQDRDVVARSGRARMTSPLSESDSASPAPDRGDRPRRARSPSRSQVELRVVERARRSRAGRRRRRRRRGASAPPR